MDITTSETTTEQQIAQAHFISRVFTWMFVGLTVTGLMSWFVVNNSALQELIFSNPAVLLTIVVAQLVEVIAFMALIKRISAAAATVLFLVYATTLGLTLSSIFLVYTLGSIAGVFLISAGLFAVMAAIGYTTQRDLTRVGGVAMMFLIGIILASVVNFFLKSAALDYIVSWIGVAVFVALTAYDMQKLKRLAPDVNAPAEIIQKSAIIGALRLYLDFVNLFLFVLRLFGRRR